MSGAAVSGAAVSGAASARLRALRALRASRWWIAAAAALLLGFLDLARGGLVLAPVLLAVAYLALVPAALLRR